MSESKVRPLITDIKSISIGYYLETSSFERLSIKNGFDSIWQQFYEYEKENRLGIILGHNHKPGDCKNALILIIKRLYVNEKELLHKILYHTFKGFLDWNFNEVNLENIFKDLQLLDFPENWLNELKRKYIAKNEIILKNRKHVELKENLLEGMEIQKGEILAAKKSEWLRLVEISELEETIKQLLEYCKNHPTGTIKDEVTNLSSRFHRIQRRVRKDIIDFDTENRELNKINNIIIQIIHKIP